LTRLPLARIFAPARKTGRTKTPQNLWVVGPERIRTQQRLGAASPKLASGITLPGRASQCAIRETLEETGVLTELTGILGVYSDPGHIVAYSDGEIRQEWELIFLGRPVTGTPTVNDEASDVRWVAPGDLEALDIHPTQWRQLRDWLAQSWPHVD